MGKDRIKRLSHIGDISIVGQGFLEDGTFHIILPEGELPSDSNIDPRIDSMQSLLIENFGAKKVQIQYTKNFGRQTPVTLTGEYDVNKTK